jgi:hypothetical protein
MTIKWRDNQFTIIKNLIMVLQPQKTEHERANFIKKFAAIVKDNVNLHNNYLVSFADVNYTTHFYITTLDRKPWDFIKLLTKAEYKRYDNLLHKWGKWTAFMDL